MLTVVAAGGIGWSVLSACSFAPQPGCSVSSSPVTCNIVTIDAAASGPFTLNAHGRSRAVSDPPFVLHVPDFAIDVPFGTYEAFGTTRADTFRITIRTYSSTTGAVKAGSFQVVSGPPSSIEPCAVTFRLAASDARPQTYRIRYAIVQEPDRC